VDCSEAIDLMGEAMEIELQGQALAEFEEHLKECGPCGTYFEQLRLTRNALRGLPRAVSPPQNRDQLIEKFRKEHRQG
jgi:predicted anti-sigma-YlaC factor YlaD